MMTYCLMGKISVLQDERNYTGMDGGDGCSAK